MQLAPKKLGVPSGGWRSQRRATAVDDPKAVDALYHSEQKRLQEEHALETAAEVAEAVRREAQLVAEGGKVRRDGGGALDRAPYAVVEIPSMSPSISPSPSSRRSSAGLEPAEREGLDLLAQLKADLQRIKQDSTQGEDSQSSEESNVGA